MKGWQKRMTISLLFAASVSPSIEPQEAFKAKELFEKDLHAYAGGDLVLSVGEITIAPGASGSRHRHPGPTFVYVLEGAVEIELEGAPAEVYLAGETFYEDPHQLHISTKNGSKTEPARILSTTLATRASH
ncbi:MAG TPA: cupin domain-containing protein [Candidatus Cybelea sp.]|jgi:quercetin dioxygenase-like cupin family protein|nr:cupin domain-containing protein [Candidatus Cybelea sp.]